MSKNSQLCGRRFRHSDFVIPSDFVIRHSDLRIAVCSIKSPVSGLVGGVGGGSVHGVRVCRSFGRPYCPQSLRRILWTPGSCFEYSTRRNCPREEVRRLSSYHSL